jgi:hypothetical protein
MGMRTGTVRGMIGSTCLNRRQEVIHRCHPTLLQVLGVAPTLNADEALRLGSGRIQPFAKGKGDGTVVCAVQDQDRGLHRLDDVERPSFADRALRRIGLYSPFSS